MAVGIHQNNTIYGNSKENGMLQDVKTAGAKESEVQNAGVQASTKADAGLMLAVNGGSEIAHTTSTLVEKNMQQYMDMLEHNQGKSSEDTETDSEVRERRRELYKSLSADEIAQLRQMQVDLSTVSLADVQGLVNAMRAKVHQDTFSQMIADVCDGIDAKQDTMEAVLPEDMSEVEAAHVLDEGYSLREEQMVYLLKNELPITIRNLYRSEYAAGTAKVSEPVLKEQQDMEKWIAPRLDQVLMQAGVMAADGQMQVPYEEMMYAAKYFVQNDIALTASAICDYRAMTDINTNGIDKQVVYRNMLMQKAEGQQSADANVYYDQRFAAESLIQRIDLTVGDDRIQQLTQMDPMWPKEEVASHRQLEELRLEMTQTAANRLVMSDIHIDIKPLSDVVKQLRALETQMAQEALADYDVDVSPENIAVYRDTVNKTESLKHMPAALLGVAVQADIYTIQSLYDTGMEMLAGQGKNARGQYALQEYEALMTAPRADMGDSIHTAFAHVDTLLDQMGEAVTEENQRAARILGYNQMEITSETLETIRQADAKVTEVLTRMTPQAVIDLIRQGKNPVRMSMDELIQTLDDMRGDSYMQEDDRYSSFLYKLEQKGDLTKEERESYIGIFRLLDKVQKHSGRDIGFVIKTGKQLTLDNLLEAHRSNQAKGMDVSASDENGMLEHIHTKGTSISEQIEAAFAKYDTQMVGQVLTMMQEEDSGAYLQETYEQMAKSLQDDTAWEMLEGYGVSPCAAQVDAVRAMQTCANGIYGLSIQYAKDLRKRAGMQEEEDAALNYQMEKMEDRFDGDASVTACYDAVSERLNEISKEELTGILTYKDIQALKQIHTGFWMLKQQADQEDYQVPLQVNGKLAVMHVCFLNQSDGGDRNQILVSMQQPSFGEMRAEMITGSEADGSAGIVTEKGIWKWENPLIEQAKHANTKAARYHLAKQMFGTMAALIESKENA